MLLCRLLGPNLSPCIDDALVFFGTPLIKYQRKSIWCQSSEIINLLKVVSGCVADVVRHLFLVSRWFNLPAGQTGHISEGLHAMLEVADKMFLKSIFLPLPQVHRCLSTQLQLFPTLILGDPTLIVILFSWIRMSMKQREGRWFVLVCSWCNVKTHSALIPAGLLRESKSQVKKK